MGAAEEITLMYTMDRAYVPTLTARNTFVVIYARKVIYHLYGFGGAGSLTLAAGYTAALTELSDLNSLVVIVTFNYYAGDILHEMDYTVGADRCAKAAADTLLRVYLGYAALRDAYGISWAYVCTVTVSETGKGTESVTREVEICRLTGLWARIDILSLLGLTSAVAGNVGNLLYDVVCLNAHNGRYSPCGTITAGGTKIRFIGYALGERLCVALTARKAASTAVCSRKTVADSGCSLVLFNTEIA